jgi:Na+-transporting NADH:ubiquinone oxidoreductase subunit NqrC
MWKSKKFIVAAVLVAVVLVAGTAGVVLAQDENQGAGPRQTVLVRVAQILGIDQQKLEDAFKQAMSEQREQLKETMDQKLQNMVKDGELTQQQVDEFNTWMKAKPDMPNVGPAQLKKMLDEGKITQQQLDAFKDWLKARPELPFPKNGKFNGQRPGPGFRGPCPLAPQSVPPLAGP